MLNITDIVTEYARFEQLLHTQVSRMSATFCADCTKICCESTHCDDVMESAWLRAVATATGADLPTTPLNNHSPAYLSESGCTLSAGRPIQCTWYVCDTLCLKIATPLDRFVYEVFSCLLGYIVRNIKRGTDLTDIEDLDTLTARQREKVLERIAIARKCMDVASRLFDTSATTGIVHDIASDMLFLTRTLPYAAGAVRFPGEKPNLSAAGHKQLASESVSRTS